MFLVVAIVFLILWLQEKKKREKTQIELNANGEQLKQVTDERDILLSKYSKVIDAEAEAQSIKSQAVELMRRARVESEDAIAEAKSTAGAIVSSAKDDAKMIRANAQRMEEKTSEAARLAQKNADKIIADAKAEAKIIAGDAIEGKIHACFRQ